VTHDVVALPHEVAEPDRLVVEVDALHGWPGRKARSFEHDEVEALGETATLRAPRGASTDDAAVHEDDPLHVTKLVDFGSGRGNPLLQAGWYAPVRMAADAPSSPHTLATASGLLLGTTGAAMLVGALLGGVLGSWGIGLLLGAIVGIPLAIFVVYRVYSGV
jgi:hypothetical protein